MKRLLALMLCAVSLGATAQVTYPYNPDGNADALIGVTDLQDMLTVYGQPFLPSEILVEGQTLTTVLTDLQHSIDSLSALSGGGGGSVLDMPLGTILPVASEAVPEGWMLCDGRELAIEDYQDLYDLIGTTYGAGDSAFWAQVFFPATTFNIPDLRGRTIIGSDDMGGESAYRVSIESYPSIGGTGGSDMDILTQEHLPEISLTFGYPNNNSSGSSNVSYIQGQVNTYQGDSPGNPDIGSTLVLGGNSTPRSNMQPYMALNYMMKVQAAEDVVATLQNTIETQQSQIDSLSELMGILYDFVYYSGCGLQTSVNYLGHEYPLVDLGDQCWFGESLSVDVFRNGDPIPFLGTNSDDLNALDGSGIGGYTFPNGDAALADQGFLYNGYVVIDDREICPIGFRLPTYDEFLALQERFLDSPDGFLDSEFWHGTNETGFSAIPTGRFENDFINVGTTFWMYGRQSGSTDVTVMTMSDSNGESQGGYGSSVFTPWPEQGFSHGRIYWSIRCIKDTE